MDHRRLVDTVMGTETSNGISYEKHSRRSCGLRIVHALFLLSVLPVCLLLSLEEQQVLPGLCTHLSFQHVFVRIEEHLADPLSRGGGRLHDPADQTEATARQSTGLQCLTKKDLKLKG